MRNFYRLILSCLMLCAALDGQSQSFKTFTYTGAFEKYVVPTTGWYLLEASGAQGGANGDSSKLGGKGTRIQTRIWLQAGDSLQIGVGGMGRKGAQQDLNSVTSGGGGGGGTSSIVRLSGSKYEPLLFGGGGGGANGDAEGKGEDFSYTYWPDLFDLEKGLPSGRGGEDNLNSATGAGYGGGFLFNGNFNPNVTVMSGNAYINGNGGGKMSDVGGGGWGGGGQGSASTITSKGLGGGGGGYNGGLSGNQVNTKTATSGTSYIAFESFPENTVRQGAANSGHGSVTIQYQSDIDPQTINFSYTQRRFRNYVVPTSGWYLLEASGGQGGPSNNGSYFGGKGAMIKGYMYFKKGDSLRIAVGSMGTLPCDICGGGGGGASSIVRVKNSVDADPKNRYEPLLVAAGGGGAGNVSHGREGLGANTWIARNNKGGYDLKMNRSTPNFNGNSGAGYFVDGLGDIFSSSGLFVEVSRSYLGGNYVGDPDKGNAMFGGGGLGFDPNVYNDPAFLYKNSGGGGGGGFTGGFGGNSDRGGGGGGSYYHPNMYHADSIIVDGGAKPGPGSVSITFSPGYTPPVVSGNDAKLKYLSASFQSYVAPSEGWYLISAAGAQGGSSSNNKPGGKGASLQGYVHLKKGDSLRIAVGGMGEKGKSEGNNVGGGGGGGATHVAKVLAGSGSYKPLIIAAGGGGGAALTEGYPGLHKTNGYDSTGSRLYRLDFNQDENAVGGTGGAGSGGTPYLKTYYEAIFSETVVYYLYGNDLTEFESRGYTFPGTPFQYGALGGFGYQRPDGKCCDASRGGFGGGGAGRGSTGNIDGGAGGGAGNSGGAGGASGAAGLGGTSFLFSQSSEDSLAVAAFSNIFISSQSGVRTGNGEVQIKYVSNLNPPDQKLFFYADQVFQNYIVPKTGWYLLDAIGARGGNNNAKKGGYGARMQGHAFLQAGDTLRIAVGGIGADHGTLVWDPRWYAGGGGGGSSIVRVRNSVATNLQDRYEPLVFAGGGGGAAYRSDGGPGQIGPNGQGNRDARGGVNGGGGGIGSDPNGGAGGGGYLGSGGTHCNGDCDGNNAWAAGGKSYLNDNTANNYSIPGLTRFGGFGGGGMNGLNLDGNLAPDGDVGGGGGGGWSGGAGGTPLEAGGGGGSYLSPRLDLTDCQQLPGYNQERTDDQSGQVIITYKPDFKPTGEITFQGHQFQKFIVPTTGWYLLDAGGAQGGPASNDSHAGGKGARMQGYARLKAGDTLRIAVGGMGQKGVNIGNNPSGGGGGGGSSILRVRNSAAANPGDRYEPLLFAGGGGGAGSGEDGSPGQVVNDGKTAAGKGGVSGGGGGIGPNKNGGAAGAGYRVDGGTHCDGDCNGSNVLSYGGQAYLSGNSGGATFNQGGDGGFGGGGEGGLAQSAVDGGGGGGGGWSGGGGGWSSDDNNQTLSTGGGGGGSYYSSSLNIAGCLATEGAISGDGFVTVKYVPEFTDTTLATYGYKGSFETYIVPKTGVYFMEAKGAEGGPASNDSHRGGYGARMQGRISLTAGDTLRIAVGGMGKKGQNNGNNVSGGGGGGGTSIVKVRNSAAANPADRYELLLISAGGGGAAAENDGGQGNKDPIRTSSVGGGIGANKNGGAGGAGYSGDGGTHCDGNCNGSNVLAYGGQAYLSGNSGGATPRIGGDGGWGGGGEGGAATTISNYGGGGGGGWTGGSGSDNTSGAGAGSYFASAVDTIGCLLASGANSGDGQVTIKFLEAGSFNYQSGSIQTYTVPVSGFYQLVASGAQGGSSGNGRGIQYEGGYGARMQGHVYLQANDKLRILVGGRGEDAFTPSYGAFAVGGGGGGATSIVKVNGSIIEPLVFAGGGGGASQDTVGGPGLTGLDGGSSRTSPGGKDGMGGQANPRGTISGGAGGGYLGNGTNSFNTNGSIFAYGGQSYQGGFNTPASLLANGGKGGYGGGGQGGPVSSSLNFGGGGSGGGGGGWSGGGSSQSNLSNTPYLLLPRAAAGGGGGGSYLSPRAVITGLTQTAGQHAGNGTAAIIGPRTSTEIVRSPGAYTWPRNGVSYRSSGLYVWIDSVNAITRTLDLRITLLGGTGGNGGVGGALGGSLMAFPNPSNGQLTLRTPSLEVAAKLEIYAVDGRRVQEYDVPARTTRFQVDLRRHGAGVYVFRMLAEGEDEYIKVIVE